MRAYLLWVDSIVALNLHKYALQVVLWRVVSFHLFEHLKEVAVIHFVDGLHHIWQHFHQESLYLSENDDLHSLTRLSRDWLKLQSSLFSRILVLIFIFSQREIDDNRGIIRLLLYNNRLRDFSWNLLRFFHLICLHNKWFVFNLRRILL